MALTPGRSSPSPRVGAVEPTARRTLRTANGDRVEPTTSTWRVTRCVPRQRSSVVMIATIVVTAVVASATARLARTPGAGVAAGAAVALLADHALGTVA